MIHSQNLERRFENRNHHPIGFAFHVMTTLDEVCMSNIVKICKKHGELTSEQARIRTPNNISCKACNYESAKRHREKNRLNLNEKSREYRKNNLEKRRKRDREWKKKDYLNNKEKYMFRAKKFYLNNIDKRKNYRYKKLYGITLDQYNEMFVKQNGLCKICKKEETAFHKGNGKIKDLAVDHCHFSGKIRGLLCGRCNCLIGYSLESIDVLQEAINHIKEFLDDKKRE